MSTWRQESGPVRDSGAPASVDLATRQVPGPSLIFGDDGGSDEPRPRSRTALAALLLSVVGGWGVSVVLAVVALRRIPRRHQRGTNLAVISLALSGVWAVVGLCLFAGAHGVRRDPAFLGPPPGQVNAMDLRVGDCFDKPPDAQSLYVAPASCTTPHDAEVLWRIELPAASYPGEAGFRELSSECADHRADVLDPNLNYPDLDIRFLYPLAQSWDAGEHDMVCFFRAASGSLTGHVGATGARLTADQQRYVDAVTYYDQLMAEIDTDPPPSWSDLRVLAGQMAQVEGVELARLTATPWPAGVQATVDALVAQDRLELPYWQRAAVASNSDTVTDAVDDAMQHNGNDEAEAVRAALHLANG